MLKINLLKSAIENNKDTKDLSPLERLFGGGGDDSGDQDSDSSSEANSKEIALKMTLLLLGTFILIGVEKYNIPQLRMQQAALSSELEALKTVNAQAAGAKAEIEKIKNDKEQFEKQIGAIEVLKKVRLRFVMSLDVIQKAMPDKMWVTHFATNTTSKQQDDILNSEVTLTLNGLAYSENEISLFIEALNKSVHFSKVEEKDSEEAIDGTKKVRKFTIVCVLEKIT